MRTVQCCLFLSACLLLWRAAAYLVYVVELLPSPREVGDLESKLVHLAWRVQEGLSLYPSWQDYPHVTNFFSPIYFLIVGSLGRLIGSDLAGLFIIGRCITVICAVLTAIVLGYVVGRNSGRGAGILAAVATLGVAPMIGAGLMVRPDTMAELLGTSGFFLTIGQTKYQRSSGLLLLVAACFTKQPALIFLLSATAVLAVTGRWSQAGTLVIAGLSVMTTIVAAGTVVEPMFAASLFGERQTAWDFANWCTQLCELIIEASDLIVIPLIGVAIWRSDRPRHAGPIVLSIALLATGVFMAAKVGSALNYFMGLGVVEALALGSIWRTTFVTGERLAFQRIAIAVIMMVSLVPSTLVMTRAAWSASLDAKFDHSVRGLQFARAQRSLLQLAEDPRIELLTDSRLLQLHQKERAPFVDPFQFHHMVNSGKIQPELMRKRLKAEAYDLVITTSDMNSTSYEWNDCGLPSVLVDAARSHYQFSARELGLFIYVPRGSGNDRLRGATSRPEWSPRIAGRLKRPTRRRVGASSIVDRLP